jgi:hypothetical protein
MKPAGGEPDPLLELELLELLLEELLLELLDPPVQEPRDVHGCPLPAGPLEVAGSLPWVHQLAL